MPYQFELVHRSCCGRALVVYWSRCGCAVGQYVFSCAIIRFLWQCCLQFPANRFTMERCIWWEGSGIVDENLVERRQAPAFDVGIVLNRSLRTFAVGKPTEMKVPVWSLRELVVRGKLSDESRARRSGGTEKTIISETEESRDELWTGFSLEFFRDGGQSYWHTLVGEQQELFVVCQDDEDGVFTPILVTADYDEAMAYQEADDTVLSVPMPEKIYHALERFVLENYTPAEKKKRKRKQWHGGEQDEAFARKPVA